MKKSTLKILVKVALSFLSIVGLIYVVNLGFLGVNASDDLFVFGGLVGILASFIAEAWFIVWLWKTKENKKEKE
jgi:hypothetical protein